MQPSIPYWKSSKSVLPRANEDGVVGLTFSPSRDNLDQMGTRPSLPAVQRIQDLNCDPSAEDSGTAPFDAKEVVCKHDATKTGNSSTASCSSSSSNAGDTSSSCDSSVVRPTKKRGSRTFSLSMPSPHRTAALIRKNFLITLRNIGYVFF